MIVSRQHYIMLHPFSRHSRGAVDVLTLSIFWSSRFFEQSMFRRSRSFGTVLSCAFDVLVWSIFWSSQCFGVVNV